MSLRDYLSVIQKELPEETTQSLAGIIVDEGALPVPGSILTSLTMTLSDGTTGTIINSRNHTNILQANGGSVDENGKWRLDLTPDDMKIVADGNKIEVHQLLIEWGWGAGKKGKQLIVLTVVNLAKVP